jgi:hypothetical protein
MLGSFYGFQQLCGINAYYLRARYSQTLSSRESEAIYGTFGLNGINSCHLYITVLTVDK